MRRFITLIICVFFVFSGISAQKAHMDESLYTHAEFIKAEWKKMDGFQEIAPSGVPGSSQIFYRGNQNIGESTYDLQTNATQQHRVVNLGDETVLACWTKGENNFSTGWPQRGTGYNQSVNSSWDPNPTARIESNIRTGWPALGYTGDGEIIVLAHIFNDPVYGLHMSKKSLEDENWTEQDVPQDLTEGTSWPRMAIGGPDGNSIHIISLYRGPALDGVANQLLYKRSLDGGDSWDIIDQVLPGLDSSTFTSISTDQYSMDANGSTIAVAVFNDFGDLIMLKSEDNGESWTSRKVIDFPIDKYVIDAGIDTTLLPDYPDAPSNTAVYSSDGTGDVKVDGDGKVHVVYGRMYLTDDDLTDGGWQYYPYTDGIAYWNEDMDDDSYIIAASTPDLNGNDTLDISNWGGTYFTGISSQPSLGFDDAGNIFLVYSAVNELLVANVNSKNYRHVYMVTSSDGGESWDSETPLDVVEEDEDLAEFIEGGAEFYYPQLAKKVDHKAHIILHADGEPGIYVNFLNNNVTDDSQGLTPTLIWYLGQTNILSSTTMPDVREQSSSLFPNPVREEVILKVNADNTQRIQWTIYNAIGSPIKQDDIELNGSISIPVRTENLDAGLYYLYIQKENGARETLPFLKL